MRMKMVITMENHEAIEAICALETLYVENPETTNELIFNAAVGEAISVIEDLAGLVWLGRNDEGE